MAAGPCVCGPPTPSPIAAFRRNVSWSAATPSEDRQRLGFGKTWQSETPLQLKHAVQLTCKRERSCGDLNTSQTSAMRLVALPSSARQSCAQRPSCSDAAPPAIPLRPPVSSAHAPFVLEAKRARAAMIRVPTIAAGTHDVGLVDVRSSAASSAKAEVRVLSCCAAGKACTEVESMRLCIQSSSRLEVFRWAYAGVEAAGCARQQVQRWARHGGRGGAADSGEPVAAAGA